MTTLRTDLIDVYIFRRAPGIEFLQLRRAQPPLEGSWQPVMGHANEGETATACAKREIHEETGLSAACPALLGLWPLQEVHPYFIASLDAVMLSPRFAVEVTPTWQPMLNEEHTAHRWIAADEVATAFMWPGQRKACAEILQTIMPAQL